MSQFANFAEPQQNFVPMKMFIDTKAIRGIRSILPRPSVIDTDIRFHRAKEQAMPINKESTSSLEAELGYIERSISWTCGRAGVEGTNPFEALKGPMDRVKEIKLELQRRQAGASDAK